MKYQVITLNGKPAIVETADMDGETLKRGADYAPFSTEKVAQYCCDNLNAGTMTRQYISWFKNDTNPSQPKPK